MGIHSLHIRFGLGANQVGLPIPMLDLRDGRHYHSPGLLGVAGK